MDNHPIIIEQTIESKTSSVWRAITDNEQMKLWYFDLPGFKAEVGYQFEFIGSTEDGIPYVHQCEITEVVQNKKLTYTWLYEGYTGSSSVTFDLTDYGNSTLVKLTHIGVETFPSDNGDFSKANFVAGWTHIIKIALKDYVEHRVEPKKWS